MEWMVMNLTDFVFCLFAFDDTLFFNTFWDILYLL